MEIKKVIALSQAGFSAEEIQKMDEYLTQIQQKPQAPQAPQAPQENIYPADSTDIIKYISTLQNANMRLAKGEPPLTVQQETDKALEYLINGGKN